MKKIVLILFLTFTGIGFSQETENTDMQTISIINDVNAYPNPFKDKTNIFFYATKDEEVTISVQNILGKVVFYKKLQAQKGRNAITFYKNKLSNGMYIYTVATKKDKISKRLVIK